MNKIAIFASHNGTIFDTLYEESLSNLSDVSSSFRIALVISNNYTAKILEKAQDKDVPNYIVNGSLYDDVDEEIINLLKKYDCEYILLAGYMKKISPVLANNFFIINSHPALLPDFGGSGMYGRFVHEAVIKSGVRKSGVTIHRVNENYDEGEIILQKTVLLVVNETVDSLENKIKELEKTAVLEALRICLK